MIQPTYPARTATNSRRGPPHTEAAIAVQQAIADRATEVVTLRHVPDWLIAAMEQSAARCGPGQSPTVLIAERPNGRKPVRLYLVKDLLTEVELGSEDVADLVAVLRAEVPRHNGRSGA